MGIEVKYQNTSNAILNPFGKQTDSDIYYDVSGRFDIIDDRSICTIRETDSEIRKRFTLAHEIGHFVLGHDSGLHDNTASFNLNHSDHRECKANEFAAELLMPKIAIEYLIIRGNITHPNELIKIFNVSGVVLKYQLKKHGWLQ